MRRVLRPVLTPNLAGALLMMASMACFTINDALIKLTGGEIPLLQVLFLRGILASCLIAALAVRLGVWRVRIAARDWRLIGLRSLSEVGAAYFFLTALMNLPIANVNAILQVLPLTVTLAAAVFFGEHIGWRRLVAIGIGFAGMLLIVRPGAEGFTIWSVYALLAVVFVTTRDLTTRRMSPGVPSLTITLSASVTVLVAAGLGTVAQGQWVQVSPQNATFIASSGLFIVGGYFFSVQVMRSGDVSFIAPFRYTSLLWALVLGWFVFGDWPQPITLAGAALIVGTGLFTLYRERALVRR